MTNDRPTTTVIVTYYNEGILLNRALRSIASQTLSDSIQVILVDDCSPTPPTIDASLRLNYELHRTPTNLHAAGARNFGATFAEGKYLMFLDADDEYCPDRIETHVDFFRKYPNVVFVGSTYWTEERNKVWLQSPKAIANHSPSSLNKTGILPPDFRYWICGDYCFNTGSITYNTTKFADLGGFREDLRWGAEWELQARAAQTGDVGFVVTPSYRYLCRQSNSITSTPNPKKYVSMAHILRSNRGLVRDLPNEIFRKSLREEHKAWLMACHLFFELTDDSHSALRCACSALRCGVSIWSIRALIRSCLWAAGLKINRKQTTSLLRKRDMQT